MTGGHVNEDEVHAEIARYRMMVGTLETELAQCEQDLVDISTALGLATDATVDEMVGRIRACREGEADTMKRPELGARVIVKARLERVSHVSCVRDVIRKAWERVAYDTPQPAVYIGYRAVSDGERCWEDEVGYTYSPHWYFEAWLVVLDPRRRPVLVRPEDCEVVG